MKRAPASPAANAVPRLRTYRQRVVIPGSLAIAAVGRYWSIQRAFF